MYAILLKIGSSLLFQLLTESFIKQFVAHSLEWAAKQSDNEVDDRLVESVKQAWNVK